MKKIMTKEKAAEIVRQDPIFKYLELLERGVYVPFKEFIEKEKRECNKDDKGCRLKAT